MTTTPDLWRLPFRDNATIPGNQDRADVAPTTGNQFYAVWVDAANFNGGTDTIVLRKFDSNGNPITGDIPLPLGLFNRDADFPSAVALNLPNQGQGVAVVFESHFTPTDT